MARTGHKEGGDRPGPSIACRRPGGRQTVRMRPTRSLLFVLPTWVFAAMLARSAEAQAPPLDRAAMMAQRMVEGSLPAPMSREDLDVAIAAASNQFGLGDVMEAILPEDARTTAITALDEQVAEWSRLGRPALIEVVRREVAASGGMSEAVSRETMEALEALWAIELAAFASLRDACPEEIRPVVDRAEALRAERFWVGETSIFGPRFETLDLETTIRGCLALGAPLDRASQASLDRLLADYRADRVRLLRVLRRANLSTAADANRVAIDAQRWALAKRQAGDEDSLDPQILVALAMAAQLLPTMEAWQRMGTLQSGVAESAATLLGPARGWCVFAAIWDAHPQMTAAVRDEPVGARVAAWIAARQQAGDAEAIVRAEAWLASDAAAVAAWMREMLKANEAASATIRRAVSAQPIDFDAIAELVAETERNPPTHMRLAEERMRSVEMLVGER